MRKSALLLALTAALAVSSPASGRGTSAATTPRQSATEAPVFSAGGTPLSNGVFFPGTLLCVGTTCEGQPYEIARGTDLRLYNLDLAVVANGHGIVSKDRKKSGAPLFWSEVIGGPDDTLVKTSHLKPGVYEYTCRVHGSMDGVIRVTP